MKANDMVRWGGSLALFTTGLLAIAFPAGPVDEGCGAAASCRCIARMAFMRRLRLLDDSQMDSDEVRGRRAAPSGRVASPTAPRRCAAGLLVALCAAATWGGKGPFLHTVASVTSDAAAPSLAVDLSGEGK